MDLKIKQAVTETKWEQLIRECQSSPLTVSEFARQNLVGQGSLYTWAKRLGVSLRHKPEVGMGFIELGTHHSKTSMDKTKDAYSVEMTVSQLTIKAEMPLMRIVELVKALA